MSKILLVPWQGRLVVIDRALLGEMWADADDDGAAGELVRRLEAERARQELHDRVLPAGEQAILTALRALAERGNVAPTVREIAAAVPISPASVWQHLRELEAGGWVEIKPNRRGVKLL